MDNTTITAFPNTATLDSIALSGGVLPTLPRHLIEIEPFCLLRNL